MSLILYLILGLPLFIALSSLVQSRSRAIPAVGSPWMFYCWPFRYFQNARDIIQQGYRQSGQMFRVALFNGWQVVISDLNLVDDIRRAPDENLSSNAAFVEVTVYRLLCVVFGSVIQNRFFNDLIPATLTRNLASRFEDDYEEIIAAFADEIPVQQSWIKIDVSKTAQQIACRTTNRVLVGLPTCRDPVYTNFSINHVSSVISGAQTIKMFPGFLKPFVTRWCTDVHQRLRQADQLLGPLIRARIADDERLGRDRPDRPDDLVTWYLDDMTLQEKTVSRVILWILFFNFATIDAISVALTHAIYCLAAYPDCALILREEVESVIAVEGWSKQAIAKMPKMESFLKEVMRVYGTNALGMTRKVIGQDFTFSNSITIPRGSYIAVAANAIHLDDANYPDAATFRPFRFSEGSRMSTTSSSWLLFGHGKHACPGRFFAVTNILTMLAHMLVKYDMKFEKAGASVPQPQWFEASTRPGIAQVLFKARKSS
ncbi:cytochrome P450 [Mycena floridula]|nr:cytochrome P450 [Mycena floridula]